MGIITIEKIDRLWWMGRYIERAFSCIKLFMETSDCMIDRDIDEYKEFCAKLGIPDIYRDKEDFLYSYPLSEKNPDSIISSLSRAMDNAMILRETIGSETLGYLQLALDKMRSDALRTAVADYFHLQHVLDLLLAFWGSVEDNVDDERIRNVARAGKRFERVDIMLRMGKSDRAEIAVAIHRLKTRLERSPVSYNEDNFETLTDIVGEENFDRRNALQLLEKLLDE